MRAAIYLSLLGPKGLRETAELCLQKAQYLRRSLLAHPRFEAACEGATFKEFVIRDRQGKVESLMATALDAGYLAGIPLGRWYPEMSDCFLITATEKRTRQEIDGLVACLTSAN